MTPAAHPHPTLRQSTASRVAKCVRLLASDRPGEVVGAAQALRRVLGAEGLDLNDLAAVIETATVPPSRPDVGVPLDWVEVARYCWANGREILSPRERAFVTNMTRLWHQPSEKQLAWLQNIDRKVRAFSRGDNSKGSQ